MNILQNIQLIIKNIIVLQLLSDNLSENDINNIILHDVSNKQLLLELADLASEEDLQLYYEIAVQGFKNLPFTPDVKVGFEMTILRMLAFNTLKLPKDQRLVEKKLLLSNVDIINNKINIDNNKVNVDNNKEFDYLSIIEKLEISGLTKDLASNAVFNLISENVIKMIIDKEKQVMITNKNINNLQLAFSKLLAKKIKLKVEYIDFSSSPNILNKTLKYQQKMKEQQFIAEDVNLQQLITNFNGQIEHVEGLS
jgi:DNA polymerase-3 subunit gamma/tau